MKGVVVTPEVSTSGCKSSRTTVEPPGQERTRVPPRQGPYGAGWSEQAGRVLEPRNGESGGRRKKSRRCARAGRQASWVREGESAGPHRGRRAGQVCRGVTRERGRALGRRVPGPAWGTGGPQALAGTGRFEQVTSPSGPPRTREAGKVSGRRAPSEAPERARGPSSRRIVRGKVGKGDASDPREGRRRRAAPPRAGDRGETARSPTLTTARQGTARG